VKRKVKRASSGWFVLYLEYRSCEFSGRLGHGVSVDAERDSDPFTWSFRVSGAGPKLLTVVVGGGVAAL
jgi:hypothetical protein